MNELFFAVAFWGLGYWVGNGGISDIITMISSSKKKYCDPGHKCGITSADIYEKLMSDSKDFTPTEHNQEPTNKY